MLSYKWQGSLKILLVNPEKSQGLKVAQFNPVLAILSAIVLNQSNMYQNTISLTGNICLTLKAPITTAADDIHK